jgi:cyclase
MNKKRLMGVITVRHGWAVQSFGYGRYLPLGHPETLVENLDRWGADEILVQCIDRSTNGLGPDFALLERLGKLGIATPLIYAGGIRHVEDARLVIQTAADRVCVDALLHDDVAAVFLNYREHAVQHYKLQLSDAPIRQASFTHE